MVAVLIATRNRPHHLPCALESVWKQDRLPEILVVVDDARKGEVSPDAKTLETQAKSFGVEFIHLRNRRSAGAAGAWNTGLDELQRRNPPAQVYIAFLDDDDAWEPNHLRLCVEMAARSNLHMVVGGIIRHEAKGEREYRHAIPDRLDAREQFIRGQHIQGSNLFVRLDQLLEAGTFDEHLPSCTDRDLCIRLADIPQLRFGSIAQHTVHHYADARPDRLSAPCSTAKTDGLNRFWRKHAQRFDGAAHAQAAQRANKLFGWSTPSTEPACIQDVPPLRAVRRQVQLVVGFTTDASCPGHVLGLLEDLLALTRRAGVAGVDVLILENGPLPPTGHRPLRDLAHNFIGQGLPVHLIGIEWQLEMNRFLPLPDGIQPGETRLPIAAARTLLSLCVGQFARQRPGAWAWILDDDKRLEVWLDRGDGQRIVRPSPDLDALCELQDNGVDVVLGPDCDAAPLPMIATLRTQLVDAVHNLQVMLGRQPDEPWFDPSREIASLRRELKESYYDLSRHTEHLETPFWFCPASTVGSTGTALIALSDKLPRILAGEEVFRPLLADLEDLQPDRAIASVVRGGSAIFFKPEVLLKFPHTVARLGSEFTRRSDMLVTLLMQEQPGLRIVQHLSAGVRHSREYVPSPQSSGLVQVLRQDVLGYALSRAFEDLLKTRRRQSKVGLSFGDRDIAFARKRVRKYVNERLAAFDLNRARILGLAKTINAVVSRAQAAGPWSDSGAHRAPLSRIAGFAARVQGLFEEDTVVTFAASVRSGFNEDNVSTWLRSLPERLSEFEAAVQSIQGGQFFRSTRETIARSFVRRLCGVENLTLLGAGAEGVVLTDGSSVYKVFDYWKAKPGFDSREFLRSQLHRWRGASHLYPLLKFVEDGSTAVLVYPFESSTSYSGGCGPDLIALLRECKQHGIVCRNIHPKNLRVAASGLKLVDYGSDLRPFSPEGYHSMAQRAWLTWRWHHRPDLGELMRRALTGDPIPELVGFDLFWKALCDEHPDASATVADLVAPEIQRLGARRVLDYGCGKGVLARRLATAGAQVVAYDPDTKHEPAWSRISPNDGELQFTADRERVCKSRPFDAVACSLVLCELPDGPEYEQVLGDLRQSVDASGTVYLAICNPLFTFGGPTPIHRSRNLPPGACYEAGFIYTEIVSKSGRPRVECHRPLSRIERDLLRHGLRVERTIESSTVDLMRFEPASDFLVLVCRPVSVAAHPPKVSLLIKTCAMEGGSIERTVEHLLGQLEGPRAFSERVLAIDQRADVLLRQYAAADLDAVREAARRLVSRGLIDRVLLSPVDAVEVSALNRRWFGVPSPFAHAANGAPLASPLWGFEQCTGEYVLQVDSDILVGRRDRAHDYLGDMIAALESDSMAVCVAMAIAQQAGKPYTAGDGARPWRVECRACLFHRLRLMRARPFPYRLSGGRLELAWHRSMDLAVAEGRMHSLRGGDPRTFFVHPPNSLKYQHGDWLFLLDLVEKGHVPASQDGHVDVLGRLIDWVPKARKEAFVFVVTGRNVPPGRARRCLDSILQQRRKDWGVVVVDDGSAKLSADFLRDFLRPYTDRVTLLQPPVRRGQLANLVLAIRHVCTNPRSVIVTLDLDDALLGADVLDRLAAEFDTGADVTVGSMLRTDKHREYPPVFANPRRHRGGNVWQHLRAFRKDLFDSIPDEALRSEGDYYSIAVDWAFMLPLVEMSQNPKWIQDALYLYEPSGLGKGLDRALREAEIASIMANIPHVVIHSRSFSTSARQAPCPSSCEQLGKEKTECNDP
jgi:glycosyltransferase involved in cell wall biosynthesis/SAM-dependent methyltransferase